MLKRTHFHETSALAPYLTVDHVLPRQWEKTWPMPDGQLASPESIQQAFFSFAEDDTPVGRIVRRNRLKDTFGNLTLLTRPLNSTVSNGPFAGKRAALQEHSLLVLNREITTREIWGENQIIERGKSLYENAKQIWALPTLPPTSVEQ